MFSETMSITAKLANGFGLTILGMGVVFAILTILSFALDVLRVFLAEKEKTPSEPIKDKTVPASAAKEDNEELVAVITAAIASHKETPADAVVVKSIRQLPQPISLWGSAGRQRQMSDRL